MKAMAITVLGWTVACVGSLAAQDAIEELRPAEMGGYAEFGSDLALQGDLALVGAKGENAHGTESGSVHALRFDLGAWVEEGRIDPADLGAGDAFGTAVGMDGDRAVVGAPGHGNGAGAAYFYHRAGGAWVEDAELAAAGAKSLGSHAALLGDTAVVAASGSAGALDRVFVFRHDGQAWSQEALLTEGEADWSVFDVALVGDMAFVRWMRWGPGLIHVFVRDDHGTPTVSDDTWSFLQEIVSPSFFDFGPLDADGDRLVAGNWASPDVSLSLFERDDHGTPGYPLDDQWLPSGSILSAAAGFGLVVAVDGDRILIRGNLDPATPQTAFLYRFDGVAWQQEATLVEPLSTGTTSILPLALDGGHALVSIYSYDLGPNSDRVSAWVEQGVGTWTIASSLLPQGLIPVGGFGCAVDVTGGSEVTVLAGACITDSVGPEAGAAYVFRSSPGGWIEDKLLPTGLAPGDRFGVAVALNGDLALVGADARDGAFVDQGAAFLFRRVGGAWSEEAELTAPVPSASSGFGAAVALLGDVALVGSPGDAAFGADTGAVDVFRFTGSTWAHEQTLYAGVPAAGADFGSAVALEDGAALIGAPGQDDDRGACTVFRYDGAAWVQEVEGGGASPGDRLGTAVALFGEEALLSAPGADSVSFCRHDPASGTWSLEQKLISGEHTYGAAVAHDGHAAVIGTPRGGTVPGMVLGKVQQLLKTSPDNPWIEAGWLTSNKLHLKSDQMAGYSVALDSGTFSLGAPTPFLDSTDPRFFGSVFVGEPAGPLTAAPAAISASAGGTQVLALDGPVAEKGKIYLVLGTLSGTDPGLVLGSWTVSINPDTYFGILLNRPDQPFTSGFAGLLDNHGDAAASLILAPNATTALVGTTAHHACVVYDVDLGGLSYVSNSVLLSIEP